MLRLPEVHDPAAEAAEGTIELVVDNAALDAIPVVATLRALARDPSGFRDAWLTKKLANLLYGLGSASAADVQRWQERLNGKERFRETGERVLALVDSVTSTWKAELVGHLFRLYLDGDCTRAEYLTAAEMVNAAITEDLRYLLEEWDEGGDSERCTRLIAVGLMRDRSSQLLLESSQVPTTSAAGPLLRHSATSERS